MSTRTYWLAALALALFCLPGATQDAPAEAEEKAAEAQPPVADEGEGDAEDADAEEADAGDEPRAAATGDRRDLSAKKEDVRILAPKDVGNELARLDSKADIKAEVKLRGSGGKKVVFKGVIRNGKLIEEFVGRRFRSQPNTDSPRSGVRLWWIEDSDGWMFFRYSNIESIALRGNLTAKERSEILRRLRAKRRGEDAARKKAEAAASAGADLEKMSPAELDGYLLAKYPADKGWTQDRLRVLKRKQIIENKPLTRDETIFVKYFSSLIKARLRRIERRAEEEEIQLGDDEKKEPAERRDPAPAPRTDENDLPPIPGG